MKQITPTSLRMFALPGIPEIREGDDLGVLITQATSNGRQATLSS